MATLDESLREFERAVESGDTAAIVQSSRAALRWIRLASAERGRSVAEIAAEIEPAGDGLEGLFRIQAALLAYVNRPTGPCELRLNGIFGNYERDSCVAIFDDEEKALAYYRSALLPKRLRYTDSGGMFRSFRSDSLCHNYNPRGGNGLQEGNGILARMYPWNNYNGRPYLEEPPPRNPAPLTGEPPSMPADAKPYQEPVSA